MSKELAASHHACTHKTVFCHTQNATLCKHHFFIVHIDIDRVCSIALIRCWGLFHLDQSNRRITVFTMVGCRGLFYRPHKQNLVDDHSIAATPTTLRFSCYRHPYITCHPPASRTSLSSHPLHHYPPLAASFPPCIIISSLHY